MNHTTCIREKWSKGQLCVGTQITLAEATVSELYGEAGFDFVWIDMEHSAMTIVDAAAHVRAARASGTAAWIRVPSDDPVVVKPILELHPSAVIVPRIDSVERAESAVRSCRYPPRGIRGYGPTRGVRYGLLPFEDYLAQVDEEMMVIIQIEHIEAIKDIDNVVSVPGVDSITVGPFDLSLSMNLPGQFSHPDVIGAIETIFRAGIKKNIPVGNSMGFDPVMVKKWIDLGLSWLSCGDDWEILMENSKKMLDEIREIATQE